MFKFFKMLLLVALLGGSYLYYQKQAKVKARIEAENIAVDHYNREEWQEAIRRFKELLSTSGGPEQERLTSYVVKCYRHLADDPSKPLAETQVYLKAIEEIDPAALSDNEKRMLNIKSLGAKR